MGNKKNYFNKVLVIAILLFAILSGVVVGSVTWVMKETPDISNYGRWKSSEATMIYSKDDKLLSRFYKENRVYASNEKIPEDLKNALIAIEDNRFYKHYGIDPLAIARALWVDIKRGEIVQGGSTITQQLAKNALLTHERTFYRKIQEAYLAIQFERMYTKQEILEFYLNEIYLGNNVYGVQTAAKYYFNKEVQDLSLAESALLAGLPKSPNYYSPYNNLEAAKRRRDIVLNRMVECGYITENEAEKAKQQPIKTENGLDRKDDYAPYFVRYVRKKLIEMYGAETVYNKGLKVYTSLSYKMQQKAKEAVENAFENYIPTVQKEKGKGRLQPQPALVTINSQTGHIQTMIGGRGEEDKYNRVVQAYRQPGSAFKPFVYTTAIEQGFSPGTVINDTPIAYQVGFNTDQKWIPRNYNGKYLGPTTLRVGLAKSINVMAVKLLNKVGIGETINTAEKMGVSSLVKKGNKNDKNLALALGGLTKGVTPLEMTSAYGVLANQGIKVEPVAILKVVDSRGNVLFKNDPKKKIVLDDEVAYLMTNMLQSVLSRKPVWGTGWRANLNRPAAGKTGTTSDYTDAWFIGYTPNLVTGVWLGEDVPAKMKYKNQIISSAEAAKLWGDYMQEVVENKSVNNFEKVNNIITQKVCRETGLVPNKYCPAKVIREELFIKGTKPAKKCGMHRPTIEVKVDTSTERLATDYCPPEEVKTYTYQKDTQVRVDENGVPVKIKNEKTGIPLRDGNGNYIYETMPAQECQAHKPDSVGDMIEEQTSNLKGEVLNIFK